MVPMLQKPAKVTNTQNTINCNTWPGSSHLQTAPSPCGAIHMIRQPTRTDFALLIFGTRLIKTVKFECWILCFTLVKVRHTMRRQPINYPCKIKRDTTSVVTACVSAQSIIPYSVSTCGHCGSTPVTCHALQHHDHENHERINQRPSGCKQPA